MVKKENDSRVMLQESVRLTNGLFKSPVINGNLIAGRASQIVLLLRFIRIPFKYYLSSYTIPAQNSFNFTGYRSIGIFGLIILKIAMQFFSRIILLDLREHAGGSVSK